MLVSSIWIISRLDSGRKFQMFTLFSGRYVGVPRLLHIGLCEFVQNNSTNISSVSVKTHRLKTWRSVFFINLLYRHNLLNISTEWFWNNSFIATGLLDIANQELFCWGEQTSVSFLYLCSA